MDASPNLDSEKVGKTCLEPPINADKAENSINKTSEKKPETQSVEIQKKYDEYVCVSNFVSNANSGDADTIVLSDSEDVVIDWFAVCDDSSSDEGEGENESPKKDNDEMQSSISPVGTPHLSPSSPKPSENLGIFEHNNTFQEVFVDNNEKQQLSAPENGENNSLYLSSYQKNVNISPREHQQHSMTFENNSANTSPYENSSPKKRKLPQTKIGGISLKFTKKSQNEPNRQNGTKFLSTAIPPPKQRKQLKKLAKTQKKVAPVVPVVATVPPVQVIKKTVPEIPSEYPLIKEYLCTECASAFKTERARDTHYNRTHLGTTANAWECIELQNKKNLEAATKQLEIKKEIYQAAGFFNLEPKQNNDQIITDNSTPLMNEYISHYQLPHVLASAAAAAPPPNSNYTGGHYSPQPPPPYSSEYGHKSSFQTHNIQLSLQLQSSHQEARMSFATGNSPNEPKQYPQPQTPPVIGYQPYNFVPHQREIAPPDMCFNHNMMNNNHFMAEPYSGQASTQNAHYYLTS